VTKGLFVLPPRTGATVPQRRVGAESDLDGAILLLASQASRCMTGSVITVDGGFLLN
jgi:NAD(P)-dependent dehydrogenase (short-subunit alcohol dehydrogenase family)